MPPSPESNPPGEPRRSSLERVIGRQLAPVAHPELLSRVRDELFERQPRLDGELEHTPEQDGILAGLNVLTDELTVRYGGRPLTVPPQNVHLLPQLAVDPTTGQAPNGPLGEFSADQQAILVRQSQLERLGFALRVCHELIHAKLYGVARLQPRANEAAPHFVKEFASGLRFADRAGQLHRDVLNEALVESLVAQEMPRFIAAHPEWFAAELAATAGARARYGQRKLADGQRIADLPDVVGLHATSERGPLEIELQRYEHPVARLALRRLCEQLAGARPERWPTPGAVFDLVARAGFAGDLLPLKRALTDVFGAGTFERLSGTGHPPEPPITTDEELLAVVDSLQLKP